MKTYSIVSAPNPGALCRAVDKALVDGWELVGGVATTVVPVGMVDQKLVIMYTQAFIKEAGIMKP